MIEEKEIVLAKRVIELAKENGATSCKVALNKSTSDLIDTLNGEIDKVSHCLDRSLCLTLIIDGRFASFSTNKLEEKELEDFVKTSISITRILEEDNCRSLPLKERCSTEALSGLELGLYDKAYEEVDSTTREELALKYALNEKKISFEDGPEFKFISEEGQYSDSEFDSITMNSDGLYCRHRETSFEYASEITIEGPDGCKASAYWWESSPKLADFKHDKVGQIALEKAISRIGAKSISGGKKTMVVSANVASKLVTPLQNALGGFSIQQNNSFLVDSLGKKIFSEKLSIVDEPRIVGESGSRLYDSEGIATRNMDIIRDGVVKTYFINTYIANKTGMEPTIEDATRIHLLPYPSCGMSCEEILKACGEGIYVTGFNGGNCNSATGDFSYGVEGFEFKDGKIGRPISEMLITGNFIELWQNLLYAGADVRRSMVKLIPTLAFENVSFSGDTE